MLYAFFWVIPWRLKFGHRGITQKKANKIKKKIVSELDILMVLSNKILQNFSKFLVTNVIRFSIFYSQ